MSEKKLVTMEQAISHVQDGDILYFGGTVDARRPMAAMYEIARQKKRNLVTLCSVSVDDFLVGADCVSACRGCYTHMGRFGKAPCVHRKMKEGKFFNDELGHIDGQTQLMAAAYGLPFVGSQYCIGSDISRPDLDYSQRLREIVRNKHKIPPQKYIHTKNPFTEAHEDVMLLSALAPDVAIIHVSQASASGTCRLDAMPGHDLTGAFAADLVIVTAEEIVPEEYLRRDPLHNFLPCNQVDYVVEAPYGAYPTVCPGYYEMDMGFLKNYQGAAREEDTFEAWMKEWVYDVKDLKQFIEKVGITKLESLKTMKPYGFRPRTDLGN